MFYEKGATTILLKSVSKSFNNEVGEYLFEIELMTAWSFSMSAFRSETGTVLHERFHTGGSWDELLIVSLTAGDSTFLNLRVLRPTNTIFENTHLIGHWLPL